MLSDRQNLDPSRRWNTRNNFTDQWASGLLDARRSSSLFMAVTQSSFKEFDQRRHRLLVGKDKN
eukprot:scaffold213654_cov42-Prasinocladus_malaysianus.AAC.2